MPRVTAGSTAESAQMAFVGADDLAFAEARRRKRKKLSGLPPAPEIGPCCDRCRSWETPPADDAYGACGRLVVTTERVPPSRHDPKGIEKGTILATEEARERVIDSKPLRTAAGFTCSRFEEAA